MGDVLITDGKTKYTQEKRSRARETDSSNDESMKPHKSELFLRYYFCAPNASVFWQIIFTGDKKRKECDSTPKQKKHSGKLLFTSYLCIVQVLTYECD